MGFNLMDGPFTPSGNPASAVFPERLDYDDAWQAIWELPEPEYMLGVNGSGEPVTLDVTKDSPHMMMSAMSGAGKSVVARAIASQALVKGATVAFCDIKVISHLWANGLPGVNAYAEEIHDVANILVSAGAIIRQRNKKIKAFPGDPMDALHDEPRIIIVVEEINSTMEELREYERGLPSTGVYKPTRAFGDIMNMGRAAKVHVVAVGQYVDATVIPKRWRESFGVKGLIKHSKDTWQMLAWQAGYPQPAPQHPGRGFVVNGERAVMTQFLYMTEEECAMVVRSLRPEAERAGVRAAVRELRRSAAQRRELRALEGGR
ncbi:hypothetical protein [Streptomyces hydrogenans]|uniref:FtsK domain-containing protein n=1 Tax=Streptomyces hydrogenans TaxID=1873719 RepID=A0ABQ3PJN6_9ACTN|nr:hypothetical protein [Streptomyces hydrogenans]GHG09947.1 hypothetical protein GCM10018784_23250 [Streptomyces hydrogenans]GHI25223.1 hypothetical protein Shyd_65940 [Streptomyces hydrogenans]